MKLALIVAALFAGGAAGCVAGGATDGPPRVGSAGCAAIAGAVGPGNVWTGRFHGQRERQRFYDGGLDTTFQRRCFESEAACRGWLYDMQSAYAANVYAATCRRGIEA